MGFFHYYLYFFLSELFYLFIYFKKDLDCLWPIRFYLTEATIIVILVKKQTQLVDYILKQ